jgi:hypothetical protein
MEAPAEPMTTEPEEPTDIDTTSEPVDISNLQQVDQTRRDAIQAFKDKQKEFLDIPEETRKNPTSDEDKNKIKTIKDELISLNKAMNDAWTEWSKINNQMLGASDDDSIEP